jgi:hypothetical protein
MRCPLGWFLASYEQATPQPLYVFLILDGVHQCRRIIRTADGRPVKRLRQGIYELESGVRPTSHDPAAP